MARRKTRRVVSVRYEVAGTGAQQQGGDGDPNACVLYFSYAICALTLLAIAYLTTAYFKGYYPFASSSSSSSSVGLPTSSTAPPVVGIQLSTGTVVDSGPGTQDTGVGSSQVTTYITAGQVWDFETPMLAPDTFQYHTPLNGTYQPWDLNTNAPLAGLAAVGSAFDPSSGQAPPDGSTQYALVQASQDYPVNVATYVSGFQPGMQLSFAYAQRGTDVNHTLFVQAYWDGAVVWSSPNPLQPLATWASAYAIDLPPPSGEQFVPLVFQVTPGQQSDETFLLDSVLVN
jgi:hypothetical protein